MWDRQLYTDEAYKQINKSDNYLKLSKTTLFIDQKEVSNTVNCFILTGALPATAKPLIKRQSKQPTLYLLTNIHKINNPGRPIVSACSCPTEHLSVYLDTGLHPVVQSVPSHTNGTADSFVRYSHVTKTRHAHQVSAATLHTLLKQAYSKDCTPDDGNTTQPSQMMEYFGSGVHSEQRPVRTLITGSRLCY